MPALTNAELEPSEAIVDRIAAQRGCIGTDKTGAYAMVSAMVSSDPRDNGEPRFFDLFIKDRVDLEALYANIGKILSEA